MYDFIFVTLSHEILVIINYHPLTVYYKTMLKLFVQALNGLPQLMGDRVEDFTEKIFGPRRKHMWNQLKNGEWKRLNGYDLVKICNTYHIPVCHLIQHEGRENVFVKPEDIIYLGEWHDVKFTPENIYGSYHTGKNQLKKFAEALGTTPSCIYRWFTEGGKCTMTVNQAIQMTYNMDLSLSFLFKDPNEPLPSHLRLDTAAGEKQTHIEICELRSQLQAKQLEINKLGKENRLLREKQHTSACRAGEEIGQYNNRVRPFMFNQGLWDNLHVVFSISKRELESLTGVSTMINTPSVMQLVQVCNALRISFGHFIQRSIMQPQLQSSTFYQDGYSEVRFVPERLNSLFCVGNILGQKRKDTLQVLGVSDMVSRRWTRDDSTLDVRQFVNLCNELDVSPRLCIEDECMNNVSMTITELLIEENMHLRHMSLMESPKKP